MRLRTKYALVLLGVLVVLGTVVVGSAELFKEQTIEQEQAALDNTTQLAAEQVEQAIADEENVIRQTGSELNTAGDQQRTLEQLLDNHPFTVALVVDSDGNITRMVGLQEDQSEVAVGDPVYEAGFLDEQTTETVLDGNTRVERVQAFDTVDDFALTIGAPVFGTDGDSIEGALVGSLFLDSTRLFSPVTPLETSQRTATITGTTYDGEEATILESEQSFDDVLTSTAQIPKTDWTLTVERDQSALTNRLQFLQYIQFGSLLVVLLTVFGLGFYQYRTTLQQTDRLLGGFEELTEGNFEYSMELEAAEEWSQIGEGFNTMTDGLKTRERQIRERERRLSVLNRVLRHNLQNDMTVIQGFAEVIPTMEDRSQREDAAEKILKKSRGLVDHGKKARRLETVMENAENGTVEVDVGTKVTEFVEQYRSEYPDVTVDATVADDAWVDAVSGVEFGIEQLIENAFEHNSADEPTVDIRVESDAETVTVTVADNGPGIPEHERDVLIQDEETSLEHGSGIGLWLAYWAVMKSEGDLTFGDQSDGGHVAVQLTACKAPADAGETEDLLDI